MCGWKARSLQLNNMSALYAEQLLFAFIAEEEAGNCQNFKASRNPGNDIEQMEGTEFATQQHEHPLSGEVTFRIYC
ncbi:hypothetical protein HOLleu_31074 [Holothuria leucospilota]|uniref:Uncharacterized protein n=1 Tax=Holothuria leucospilota TaxID=206669 RepID=A0A9Q1BLM3_HOLLE|nr:hypothetical protein HOLleu_31074 [Holothuria leucospilota]